LGVGDNIENGGLTKSPYEDQESDDDFMPARQPKRKKAVISFEKESVGSTKKAKTTKDTLSSSHGVPKPSSSAG
ncbi:9809_t:CDS:2, partial [Rhizophagus irregularis]